MRKPGYVVTMDLDVRSRGAGSPPVRNRAPRGLKARAALGFVFALLALSVPVFADDGLNAWQAQKRTFEKLVEHMPLLDKHRIEDVLRVRVENNCLVVHTPLPNTVENQYMRVKLDGIGGTALVLVQRKEGEKPASAETEPLNFTLSITDYTVPRRTTSLAITYQPNLFNLSRSIQLTDGRFNQVSLTQQRGPQSNGGGLLQLMVTDAKVSGAAPTQLNFESPDFFTFLREHPQEANQYLRPLLRDVGQEEVFAPNERVAWQVFSALWTPDAKTARKVRDLLPSLNDANYRVRNEATLKLQELGSDGAAVMVHLDRTKLTPEQNTLIDRALVRYAQLPTRQAERMRSDPAFLLDCLYSADATIRRAALQRLSTIAKAPIPFDVNADAVTRARAVAVLRQQLLGKKE